MIPISNQMTNDKQKSAIYKLYILSLELLSASKSEIIVSTGGRGML